MHLKSDRVALLLVAALVAGSNCAMAVQSREERSLNELRNTVVNLLQALVERGVVTREQAEAMVRSAQEKAAADAAAAAAQEDAEAGAVRVPYVPEIVKEEIRRQVAADLAPEVAKEVVEQARTEEWGVPGALPDWVNRVRWSGDIRVRGQGDAFAEDNLTGFYTDINAVNEAGGLVRAGENQFINVTEDRQRLRARLRLGLEADLSSGWSLGARITSGNLTDPISTNQTLGNYGARYETGIDLAWLNWTGTSSTGRHTLSTWAGRMPNPWLSTPLVWDVDLAFDGVAAHYRLGLSGSRPSSRFAFLTLGAFPLQEFELSSRDKWLYGAQLGLEWKLDGGSALRFGAAVYDYEHIVGVRNALDSELLDFTAPPFVQRGNTLFDIRNDDDPTTERFALASDFTLLNATASLDFRPSPAYRLALLADYVTNVAYDEQEVLARTGLLIPERTDGYQTELSFGSASMARANAWRASIGYRYVQGDAVLDAFTDSDFHLGGTDAKGYFFGADYAFTPRVFMRVRYLSANEIDGPPLGIDVLQLDLNAQF